MVFPKKLLLLVAVLAAVAATSRYVEQKRPSILVLAPGQCSANGVAMDCAAVTGYVRDSLRWPTFIAVSIVVFRGADTDAALVGEELRRAGYTVRLASASLPAQPSGQPDTAH